MNAIDLANRVAIVTGAGGGLGKAIALRLAASGARVTAVDRDVTGLAGESLPDNLSYRELDVIDPEAVGQLMQAVGEREGRIDILVHSAAILGASGPVADYSLEEWNRVIGVNLTGTFIVCKAVVPWMTRAGYGRIVNISSAGGKDGHPMMPAYVAAKAGVIGFTKSLGKEVARNGVIVNCVTPGPMDTPMGPGRHSQIDPEVTRRVMEATPLGRIAQPEEVAAMVAWMVSEECSFSTAATFDASGGRTTY